MRRKYNDSYLPVNNDVDDYNKIPFVKYVIRHPWGRNRLSFTGHLNKSRKCKSVGNTKTTILLTETV